MTVKKGFECVQLNEDEVESDDETHFLLNMNKGKTLAFIREKEVKYADGVSRGEPFTIMVRPTGGIKVMTCPPVLIFKNHNRSRSIIAVNGNIQGVCYRYYRKLAWSTIRGVHRLQKLELFKR